MLLLMAAASAHVPVVYYAGPDEDWCGIIAGTQGSDIVMLLPGTYLGPCDIHANLSDVASEQTSVQSFDPNDPARFVGSAADYVLSVTGEQLVLFQLSFEGLPAEIDAIRIGDIRSVWVRWSWFRDLPGTAVRTVGTPQDLLVTDNELTSVGTGVAIGCPDGSCVVPAFEIEGNLLVGATLGFEVGPGSLGQLHDNVVTDAVTAARLHGAGPGGTVTFDGELYGGAGPLIDVIAGPASITSSVVLAETLAVRATGVDGVDLVGDTILGPVELSGGVRLVDSALDRPAPDGIDATATFACEDVSTCFTDAAGWDLYPSPGSPLRGAGQPDPALLTDWCGRTRGDPPTVGAFEVVGSLSFGPLEAVFKREIDCTLLPDAEDTGTGTEPPPITTTTGDPARPRPASGGGCGCATGVGLDGALLGVAVAGLIRTIRGVRTRSRR